jgi:hypothetical protein
MKDPNPKELTSLAGSGLRERAHRVLVVDYLTTQEPLRRATALLHILTILRKPETRDEKPRRIAFLADDEWAMECWKTLEAAEPNEIDRRTQEVLGMLKAATANISSQTLPGYAESTSKSLEWINRLATPASPEPDESFGKHVGN